MSKGVKKAIPVLIVDDDDSYVDEDFKLEARIHGLQLFHAHTTEQAIEILEGPDGKKIKGFIVDILGYVDSSQTGAAKRGQYFATKKYITTTRPALPFVTVTGFEGEYEIIKDLTDVEKTDIYVKGKDEEKMFEEMYSKLSNLDAVVTIKNNQDVFNVIDDYFDGDAEELLIYCLQYCTINERPVIKGVLNNVRTVYEQFFYELNKHRKDLVPDTLIRRTPEGKPQIDFSAIYRHLKGNYDSALRRNSTKEYLRHGSYMDRLMEFLYRICSEDLHLLDKEIPRQPSKYTATAATNILLEMILAFKSIVKEPAESIIS